MSDKDRSKDGPIEPEIIDEGSTVKMGGLSRMENAPVQKGMAEVIADLFYSAKSEERRAREWADAARAYTGLNEARTDLIVSIARLKDVDVIVAKDDLERAIGVADAQERLDDLKTKARLRKQADEFAAVEMAVKLAEARRRLREVENPAPPPDENSRRREAVAKKFRDHLGRRFTEHEVRAHADQLIAEIKARAGDEISPATQREIDNVTDVMNRLLDEL